MKKIAIILSVLLMGLAGFAQAADLSVPVNLTIPSINVDALINPMGLTKNGAMEAPTDAKSVGWFKFGPNPGDVGTAVIDGHYGRWKNGNTSVFDNLNKLKAGDKLYVKNKQGASVAFVVRQLLTYDKDADAADVFTSDDQGSHLNIIACAGVYSKILKTYSNRLVVFADRE